MREEPLDFWTRQLKTPAPPPPSEPKQPREPFRWALWGKRLLALWVVSNVVALFWHWRYDRYEDHVWECSHCGARLYRQAEGGASFDGGRSYGVTARSCNFSQVSPRTRFTLWQPWNWLSDVFIRPYGPGKAWDDAYKTPPLGAVV